MPLDPETEQRLIREAKAGDQAALQGLLITYYDQIESQIRPRFTPELAAHLEVEDVIQEVLVDAYRGIASYREREDGSFLAWIRRIAQNQLIDTVRHYRRLKRGGRRKRVRIPHASSRSSLDSLGESVCADSDSPYRAARIEEVREMMRVCMAGLNDDQRRAIEAHYFEQMDPNEIAKELSRTPGAVRELLRRARTRLAEFFGAASAWLSSR